MKRWEDELLSRFNTGSSFKELLTMSYKQAIQFKKGVTMSKAAVVWWSGTGNTTEMAEAVLLKAELKSK